MKKILIFSAGTIGDTVTALPAIQRICEYHKNAEIHLYNSRFCKNDVHKTLFDHLNLFDKMFFRQVPESLMQQPWKRISNWFLLFREQYDIIYELPCNMLTPKAVLKSFFAKRTVAMEELNPDGVPRFRFLLNFLEQNGIPRCKDDEIINWNFQPEEIATADAWFSKLPVPCGKTPFIVCTGGKGQLQHWPLDRYAEVLKKIVPEYHLYPVFVGAGSDAADAEYLIRECGTGIFSQEIGPLSLREMIIVFKKFKFYFGNDTGILHIAGAAGIPTFAISSARDPKNFWHPLNDHHHSFVADVPCKECRKNECPLERPVPCMEKISVEKLMDFFEEDQFCKDLLEKQF